MRIILDENIPWPIADWLAGYEITTVQREGWSGVANGELIEKIDGLFDLFITADKNLRYQRDLRNRKISILELPTNRWPKLSHLKQEIMREISEIKPSEYRTASL
jgi:hypothetical protein